MNNPHNKYAPGLGGKINGQIASMLLAWKRAGIGQGKERHGRR